MTRLRTLRRLAAILALASSLGGCLYRHPEWQWYDTGRHPVGGVPAQAGYYTGVYLLYPVGILVGGCVALVYGFPVEPEEPHLRAVARWHDMTLFRLPFWPGAFGVATGSVVGAPFHLVALPFEDWGGEELGEFPEGFPEGTAGP